MSEEVTLVDLTDDIAEEAITAIDAEALPPDWQLLRLGDVVTVKGGKRLPKGLTSQMNRRRTLIFALWISLTDRSTLEN